MSLKDLKKFALGLSIFKIDMVEFRKEVKDEIKCKEANKRRAPTTAEKSNSKYLDQRTGGQQLGSFFSDLLR